MVDSSFYFNSPSLLLQPYFFLFNVGELLVRPGNTEMRKDMRNSKYTEYINEKFSWPTASLLLAPAGRIVYYPHIRKGCSIYMWRENYAL